MNSNDLFTAPQVAKICSVNLKTIHNWVERGEMKSFRTPGRHLRFRRQDIVEFLSRFGYPVPEGFQPTKRRIVLISDNGSLRPLARSLSRDFDVEAFSDQVDALLSIGQQRPDLVLVNTDCGDNARHLVDRLAATDGNSPVVAFGLTSIGDGRIEFVPTNEIKEIRKRVGEILNG